MVDKRALTDIQSGVDYYNAEQTGLGKRFYEAVERGMTILESHPKFQVRYDHVRCLPLGKFPFMIHFTVDEKYMTVYVHGVIHTSLDPKKHWVRNK